MSSQAHLAEHMQLWIHNLAGTLHTPTGQSVQSSGSPPSIHSTGTKGSLIRKVPLFYYGSKGGQDQEIS